MSEITRYDFVSSYGGGSMERRDDGDFIYYDLHERAMAEKEAALATLKARYEGMREALEKIIEWCDGTRGADFDKAPFETIGDCARAALASLPVEGIAERVAK